MTNQTTGAEAGAEPGIESGADLRSVLGLLQPAAVWDDATRTADGVGAQAAAAAATAAFGAEPADFRRVLCANRLEGGDA